MTRSRGDRTLTTRNACNHLLIGRATRRPPLCGRRDEGGFREELTMTATQAHETGTRRDGGPATWIEQLARRRGDIEALGLLFGILGVLLVLAVTVGAAPPIGR
jgi:hypothetical protein